MPEIVITKTCVICGRVKAIKVPENGYKLWAAGMKKIQDAMPLVPAEDREMLMSGICPLCFDKLFGYGD